MNKKSAASIESRRAIRAVLHEFVSRERGGSATPDQVAKMISNRAFSGIGEGAFRFPAEIKAIRKTENSK